MRVAPPVRALTRGTGPWQSIQRWLYGSTAAIAVWWGGAHMGEPDVWLAVSGVLAGLGAGIAVARLGRTPPQSLTWDGNAWQLAAPGGASCAGQAAPMLDLGSWMLVRFTPGPEAAGGRRHAAWLPLSRDEEPAAWPALRVALHASPAARRAA